MEKKDLYSLRIVLFDIDGTLIHSGGAGRKAMVQAFRELFGIPNGFEGISMAGKTDPAILLAAFETHRIPPTDSNVQQFKRRYFALLQQEIQQNLPLKRVYPGVKELLEQLNTMEQIQLGLLTGNWLEGAEIKLSYFQLYQYFRFGAFGSDSGNRNELLPFALSRCSALNGRSIDLKQVVVIGDTPNDVECGKVHGARTLAVASGSFSEEVLQEKGADMVLPNLEDQEKIVQWILQ